jgi:cysteine dioxygenase
MDHAGGDVALDDIESWIARTRLSAAERRAFVRFDQNAYRRNLVCRRDDYEALVLCWRPGQHSPVHDHRGSRCTLAILAGEAIEVRFERDAADRLRAVSYQPLPTGAVTSSVDSDLHVVANWTRPSCDLVTLHVYSPPLRDMRIYPDAEVVPVPFEQLRRLDPPPVGDRRLDRVVCRQPGRGGS